MGFLDVLVSDKYLVDIITTLLAIGATYLLGEEQVTTTRSAIVTVVVMNFNISLLFIQYYGDVEIIKFVWVTVWLFWIIALGAAYALGVGGFDVSMGTVAEIVRRVGSPLVSGVIVLSFCTWLSTIFSI